MECTLYNTFNSKYMPQVVSEQRTLYVPPWPAHIASQMYLSPFLPPFQQSDRVCVGLTTSMYSVSKYICSVLWECKSRYHRLKRQVLLDALLDFLGVVWREWLALPSGSRTSLPIRIDFLEGGECSILFECFPTVVANRLLQKLSKRLLFSWCCKNNFGSSYSLLFFLNKLICSYWSNDLKYPLS